MGKPKKTKADAALIQSSLSGETKAVLSMLEKQFDVSACDAQGNHPLGAAACGGHLELVQALCETHNAPLELTNDIGTTPLWLAAGYGHTAVLEYLLGRGADVNTPNSTKDTPLVAAASKGHTACVARLVAAGARHITLNSAGDSPLSLAVAAGNLEMVQVLLPLPGSAALLRRKNAKGVHPLSVAAAAGHAAVLEALVAAGGKGALAERDANGATPLALTAFCGHADAMRALLKLDGVDIECVDHSGATPLWLAASAGHAPCLQLLLDAGACAGVTCAGKSALDAATKNKHAACRDLLSALPPERLAPVAPAAEETDAKQPGEEEDALAVFTRVGLRGDDDAGADEDGPAGDGDFLEGVAPEDH